MAAICDICDKYVFRKCVPNKTDLDDGLSCGKWT